MNSDIAKINARKAEILRAFLNQVPGRVSAILENWHQLVQGDWNEELLAKLLERIDTLSEAGGKFGVNQIKHNGLSLQAQLAEFSDSGKKPSHDDVVAFDGLIHAFKDAAVQACDQHFVHQEPESDKNEKTDLQQVCKLFLLGIDESSAPGLYKNLQARNFQVEELTDTQPLFEHQRSNPETPAALISHIDWLESLYPESRDKGLWHQEGGLPGMPVTFIADGNDLKTRLAAMRTEAKAFWTQPVDPFVVATRMQELTSSESHSAYRVLIVEDDPSQAQFASAILSKADFECRSVTDPLQVMDVLYDFRPDLILMDLYMPGASGSELTAVIREQSEFVDTPIVFLSGEQDLDKQLKALSFGGEDFLAKPIGPKHLINTVTNRIHRSQQLTHSLGVFNQDNDDTGLYNRNYLLERVESLLLSKSFDEKVHAVFYLEVDSADQVLNTIGISGIDVVLAEISSHLSQTSLQPQDVLSRFGDKSMGLLASRDSLDELEAFGTQLCAKVAEHIITVENHNLGVTLSLGAYSFSGANQDARSLFSHAKLASRHAHEAGGNQVFIKEEETQAKDVKLEENVSNMILKAIENNHFQMLYQPMVALKGASEKANYQTLIRLQEPDGTLLTAGEFIPAAEQMGIVSKIDQWTIRTALSVIHANRQQSKGLHLFVSQSVDLLENLNRLAWLQEKHRTGFIQEDELTFEFRISEVEKNMNSAKICFETLAKMGISSLLTGVKNAPETQNTLTLLPISYIKLDTHLLQDQKQELKALISLAHSLKIKVIAPQVEDPSSIALLWSSGTDLVQGNFVQRPESNLLYDFNESVLL